MSAEAYWVVSIVLVLLMAVVCAVLYGQGPR